MQRGWVKSFLSLICIVLLLTGCATGFQTSKGNGNSSSPSPEIYGVWVGEADFAPLMQKVYESASFAPYIEIDDLTCPFEFTFNKNGTFSMTVKENDAREFVNKLKSALKNAIMEYAKEYVEETGSDLLSKTDIVDLYLDQALSEEGYVPYFTEQHRKEGRFLIEGNKLYMSDSLEEEIDRNCYDTYRLSSTQLVFEEHFGYNAEKDDSRLGEFYPLILLRKS